MISLPDTQPPLGVLLQYLFLFLPLSILPSVHPLSLPSPHSCHLLHPHRIHRCFIHCGGGGGGSDDSICLPHRPPPIELLWGGSCCREFTPVAARRRWGEMQRHPVICQRDLTAIMPDAWQEVRRLGGNVWDWKRVGDQGDWWVGVKEGKSVPRMAPNKEHCFFVE